MESKEVLNELNYLIHDSPERVSAEVMKGLKDAVECIEDMDERISIMAESEDMAQLFKFAKKTIITMPRLSGKTIIQIQSAIEKIKSGEPVVFITKDKTTEFKPVVICRDCIHWRKDGYCKYNNHVQENADWFCADGEPKGGKDS